MGLDMRLYKAPRYKNDTPTTIDATNMAIRKENGIDISYVDENYVKENVGDIDYYKQFYKKMYYWWDEKHEHPYYGIIEEVGYWANAWDINKWFINRLKCNIDDPIVRHEVTEDILYELKSQAEYLLENFNNAFYDEEKIKGTIEICDEVIKNTNFKEELIFYEATW